MTTAAGKTLPRAAVAAVRDCAETLETQAASLQQQLPSVAIEAGLRATALELSAALKDVSSRVTFELALLQTELGAGTSSVATAVERLTHMDASMMSAVAALTDVVDQLETAAERDERNEPAFVLVIEATGVMLQALAKARAATEALRHAVP
jgi:CRISPR/Cas system CMR-associated protein Cmr5 small subunit